VGTINKYLIAVLMLFAFGVVSAECMTTNRGDTICGKGECKSDRYGNVYCSAFYKGSAVQETYGNIVCGIGKCVVNNKQEVICSTEIEGVVTKDIYGNPLCQGSCEIASEDYCESEPIGK